MTSIPVEIIQFGNHSKSDQRFLKQFVDFHWKHYTDDPEYIPLLDFEYMGSRLLGMKGFFEPDNLLFKHADMTWLLAMRQNRVVARCIAFVNDNYNNKWNERTGFFGLYESIKDNLVTKNLLDTARAWLKDKGMTTMRGPFNLPVNEATPGILTG